LSDPKTQRKSLKKLTEAKITSVSELSPFHKDKLEKAVHESFTKLAKTIGFQKSTIFDAGENPQKSHKIFDFQMLRFWDPKHFQKLCF